ncbi:MAG: acetyl-CoA carboxylase biotin carboxylase subunit [Acidobacteria bacterium]|nr:MAG: acetyl-CoA carboxylase biotin carboxylase subunit [Acidobacteriota bacterium]
MFQKILVANRGEIALRIICACKELGIPTVAVYSQADQDSLHVRFADEAICIGPPKSSESYLNIPGVISAAEISNADAIHPGYGFLAESAYFAEVCEACGLTFIGPSPEVIQLMGDKDAARRAMKEAGLPVLPGTGKLQGPASAIIPQAEEIGYPVILKAVAGGGGKGMRIVDSSPELAAALGVAQSESESAFGSSEVYLEKYLPAARHIEFQILADHHGTVMHLGERECTIQRRHQKLLEEAPSSYLTREMREAIGNRVVEAVRAVNYTNAGTVELLFDDLHNYYFMEMNTRIQVEHPVTEMITGLDLVKEQIRIAAGERLAYRQEEIEFRGHALECRINAECPDTFLPSPGKITAFHPPTGIGVRVDTAAYTDDVVTPYYDSLIAKVITHGKDRLEAVRRMQRALEMTIVEGVKTTIPLHQRVLQDHDFLTGRISTRFLERWTTSGAKK